MKKDEYIDNYCKGNGIEIGEADNCVEGIDTLKIDNKTNYFHKNYTVDYILEATNLHAFEDTKFDFVITIHVMEHLTNPIKALLEWNRVVKVEKNSLLFKERFEELKKGHYHSWVSYLFDLSPYIGKRFTIFAEDNGLGWGQWVGFAQPVLLNLR